MVRLVQHEEPHVAQAQEAAVHKFHHPRCDRAASGTIEAIYTQHQYHRDHVAVRVLDSYHCGLPASLHLRGTARMSCHVSGIPPVVVQSDATMGVIGQPSFPGDCARGLLEFCSTNAMVSLRVQPCPVDECRWGISGDMVV